MTKKLLPQIVRVTPSNYADYLWCRRLFYIGALLQVPASDSGVSADQGLLVHDVLEQVHAGGSCHDSAHVDAVLRAADADTDQMRGYVARHARRCPQEFDKQVHESDRVRFHREPAPMFLASARIDAIWIHDGMIDARDYKTGRRPEHALSEDARARVQAWILGFDAQRTGLRLRLRYEYLQPEADDDPDPWEPDRDDLAAIGEELRVAVASMWNEEKGDDSAATGRERSTERRAAARRVSRGAASATMNVESTHEEGDDSAATGRDGRSWQGVADPQVCRTCRYRSICRDSAAPGEPEWPVLSGELDS